MSDFHESGGFVAGFAARHEVAAGLLQAAFAPPGGFAPSDPRERIAGAVASGAGMPRHFSPANPGNNPTAGWNPLDACTPPAEQPFVDPVAAARAEGYAEGLADATALAGAERDRDGALIQGIAGQLSADRIDRAAIAAQLRQTVMLLVTRVVGDVGVAADRLTARVEIAARMLADAQESAMLRVHPEDVALLEGRLPATIFAVGDAQVSRGSFVLESASTMVEDGPALWLEQLTAAIDRVPLPQGAAAC
ncbi:FliH/SctL family protein [Sphingomonas sp. Leaf343]|uniref:FliH/SctL family protein n=1 Tax=Sphingomonas sp. Leaf343 TaxID=1736345 RepID=UPI0006F9FBC0|nr:FliH/SctL family protein [Sphingomonas sp. Leaf343]KQR82232.1 flagellar biosynthesis protein FliH [Sphingomonas sp. Leaf343]